MKAQVASFKKAAEAQKAAHEAAAAARKRQEDL